MNKEHLLTVTELWKKFIEKEFNRDDTINMYKYDYGENENVCAVCGGKISNNSVMLGQNSLDFIHISPLFCAEALWRK